MRFKMHLKKKKLLENGYNMYLFIYVRVYKTYEYTVYARSVQQSK